jgi:hypothetical protein
MTEFTPGSSLFGGALIGCAAVLMMAASGRIAGVSGIVAGLLRPVGGPICLTSLAFVAGLVGAPLFLTLVTGDAISQTVPSGLVTMAIAGGLVGFGTALGSGCTSGHGVCGVARLSPRSLVATAVFMAVGVLTVFLARHVFGA